MLDSTPLWKEAYKTAVRNLSHSDLPAMLYRTEDAIFDRLQEIHGSPDHHEERQEIEGAAADLLVIKTRVLGWPGFGAA